MRPPARPSNPPAQAGPRSSSKRDLIVEAFLRHEGAVTADDLVSSVQGGDRQISRATVYRTLQWMVDAGMARKVDAGAGAVRFEHSYRHPRHFHLMCRQCSRSFEFFSTDIESSIEEVAEARGFAARQSVLQVFGTCEACRSGQEQAPDVAGCRGRVRARRVARGDRDRAQRARVLHARRAAHGGVAGPRVVPEARRRGAIAPDGARGRSTSCCWTRTRNWSRARRCCSSRMLRTGCSPEGAEELDGVGDLDAA